MTAVRKFARQGRRSWPPVAAREEAREEAEGGRGDGGARSGMVDVGERCDGQLPGHGAGHEQAREAGEVGAEQSSKAAVGLDESRLGAAERRARGAGGGA